jgi:hypothetical protein
MDTTKLKLLITEQFPEFYREEYPQFIEFVKKYYEYLESTNSGKVGSIKDLDNTLDLFITYLKNDLAKNIPEFGKLDDRSFLRFAKEFYTSRGSEDSYRFLFRAMFGKEVDIFYPSTVILRASDGRWEQDLSIRIFVSVGTAYDVSGLAGNKLTITNEFGRATTILVLKVKEIATDLYELFIDRFFSGTVAIGNSVSYSSLNVTISGVVSEGASTVSVVEPGAGFIAGSFFEVTGSTNLKLRASKVDQTGAILKSEIIAPGNGFSAVTYALIEQSSRAALAVSTTLMTATGNQAVVQINPGPLLKYPGFYSSSNGFLSDAMYLQDNDYYQAFSYVIKLDEQLSSYKTAVKKLLHPDGMALWGQFDVSNEFNITMSISETISPLIQALFDTVSITDELLSINTTKGLEETLTITDELTFNLTRPITETVTLSDSGSIEVQTAQTYASGTYFAETYAKGAPSTTRTW